jgi:hypothetical protein
MVDEYEDKILLRSLHDVCRCNHPSDREHEIPLRFVGSEIEEHSIH